MHSSDFDSSSWLQLPDLFITNELKWSLVQLQAPCTLAGSGSPIDYSSPDCSLWHPANLLQHIHSSKSHIGRQKVMSKNFLFLCFA